MRTLFEWLWKLGAGRPDETQDIRSYHARRHAQELVLQRQARTPAARQAHHALALAHLQLMEAIDAGSGSAAPRNSPVREFPGGR